MRDEGDSCDRSWRGVRRTQLTPEQLAAYQAFHARYPGYGRRGELLVAYAQARGGLILEFLKLHQGPEFGEPTFWSVDACAEELAVAQSDLLEILAQLGTWVEPQLRADPAWRALRRNLPKVATEIVGPDKAAAFTEPRGFSHLEFSDAACRAVVLSPEIAERDGAAEVLRGHLRSATDEAERRDVQAPPAPSLPFARETMEAVGQAVRLGHADEDVVELTHLRTACGT